MPPSLPSVSQLCDWSQGSHPYHHSPPSQMLRSRTITPWTPTRFRQCVSTHPYTIDQLRVTNVLDGHTGCVNTLQWSSNGQWLLSGSDDTRLCLWRADQNFELAAQCNTGHTSNIFCARFMPCTSDSMVVSCAGDGQIRVFDITRQVTTSTQHMATSASYQDRLESSFQLRRVYTCHHDRVKRIVTENDNPHVFITCGEDGKIHQFDLRESNHHDLTSSACRNWLVDYHMHHIDLYTISLNQLRKNYLASGGSRPYVFLHDRRMLPRPVNVAGRPEGAQSVARLKPRDVRGTSRVVHPTAVKFSEANGEELLSSWSAEKIYLFNVVRSMGDAENETANISESRKRSASSSPSLASPRPEKSPTVPFPVESVDTSTDERISTDTFGPQHSRIAFIRRSVAAQNRHRSLSSPSDGVSGRASRPSAVRDGTLTGPFSRPRSVTTSSSSLSEASATFQTRIRESALLAFIRREPQATQKLGDLISQVRSGEEPPTTGGPNSNTVPTLEQGAVPLLAFDYLVKAMALLRELQPLNVEYLSEAPEMGREVTHQVYADARGKLDRVLQTIEQTDRFEAPNSLDYFIRVLYHWYTAWWWLNEPGDPEASQQDLARNAAEHCQRHLEQAKHFLQEALAWEAALPADESVPPSELEHMTEPVSESGLAGSAATVPIRLIYFGFHPEDLQLVENTISYAKDRVAVQFQSTPWGEVVVPLRWKVVVWSNFAQDLGWINRLNIVSRSLLQRLHISPNQIHGTTSETECPITPERDLSWANREARPLVPNWGIRPFDVGNELSFHQSTTTNQGSDTPANWAPQLGFDYDSSSSEEQLSEESDWDAVAERHRDKPEDLRAGCDADTTVIFPRRVYKGHSNVQTVKDVNFFGPNDEYIMSGSDDGNLFIWDKATATIKQILQGDTDVVNVLQGHPFAPYLAVSGIDNTIKIISPYKETYYSNAPRVGLAANPSYSNDPSALDGPSRTVLTSPAAMHRQKEFPYYSESLLPEQEAIVELNEMQQLQNVNYTIMTQELLATIMGPHVLRRIQVIGDPEDSDLSDMDEHMGDYSMEEATDDEI
ncbi:hypothetical protein IWQ62_001559 [Dispira parvispora]|uniref:WD40 repeat-like protein n=1 Tax=Dispira parvispora TaxID=1520584 RepID=A0A9W8E8E9_9FUNG|nr:hypothetical protein IWQ62_001559 [Dispira parvispora]